MKRLIVSFLMMVMVSFAVQASEDAARKFAENTANKAVEILATDKSDSVKVVSLENLFVSSVDTNWIGRFVLGKHWLSLIHI